MFIVKFENSPYCQYDRMLEKVKETKVSVDHVQYFAVFPLPRDGSAARLRRVILSRGSSRLGFFREDKRGDREVERLFKILECSMELKESQHDRTEQLGNCHLPSLNVNIDVTLSLCERVLQKKQHFGSDRVLQENREIRKLEWEKFVNDTSEKCEKVNQTFEEKENEVREFYIDLEKKLHITP